MRACVCVCVCVCIIYVCAYMYIIMCVCLCAHVHVCVCVCAILFLRFSGFSAPYSDFHLKLLSRLSGMFPAVIVKVVITGMSSGKRQFISLHGDNKDALCCIVQTAVTACRTKST